MVRENYTSGFGIEVEAEMFGSSSGDRFVSGVPMPGVSKVLWNTPSFLEASAVSVSGYVEDIVRSASSLEFPCLLD